MPATGFRRKLIAVFRFFSIWGCFWGIVALLPAQAAPPVPASPSEAQAYVGHALGNELHAAQDTGFLMRYRLRKSTPRLTSTREIYETKSGFVARLLSINGEPLNTAAERKEEARLKELAGDPARQHHRKQEEDADRDRAVKMLRVIPVAFLFSYSGKAQEPAGTVEKFSFRPNPSYSPPDLETQVLSGMAGEIWIDPSQDRVVRLEGHLERDVDFGWGILGRLNKGGWIVMQQAEVLPGQWRMVRMQMAMTGRVLFRTKRFDVTQEQSQFSALPANIGYREAIEKLLAGAFVSESHNP